MKKNVLILLLAAAVAWLGFLRLQENAALPAPVAATPPRIVESPPAAATPEPVAVTSPVAPTPPQPDKFQLLGQMVQQAHMDPGLAGCGLGFVLLDPTGNVVVDVHGTTALIPASTLKTVTTATALRMLGPDYTFQTRLLGTAAMADGVLRGDLVLLGGGDPTLNLARLGEMVASVRLAGLRHVTGRVLADGRHFRKVQASLFNDFWNWGDIGNGYGSPVNGLNLEHNRFTAVLRPGKAPGEAASIASVQPQLPGVQVANEVLTAQPGDAAEVMIYGGERTGLVTLRGSVAADELVTTVEGAVPDPERFAAYHLRQLLIAGGVRVDGSDGVVGKEQASEELAVSKSPPLREIAKSIHEVSDNHETDCLFLTLGLQAAQKPVDCVREHWKQAGLEFAALRMTDGCGLGRSNHIRPLDLARLQHLTAADTGPAGRAYVESLLVNGKVRWKGGAMSSIRSTTGYLEDSLGIRYSFALLVNHYTDLQAVNTLRSKIIETVNAW